MDSFVRKLFCLKSFTLICDKMVQINHLRDRVLIAITWYLGDQWEDGIK